MFRNSILQLRPADAYRFMQGLKLRAPPFVGEPAVRQTRVGSGSGRYKVGRKVGGAKIHRQGDRLAKSSSAAGARELPLPGAAMPHSTNRTADLPTGERDGVFRRNAGCPPLAGHAQQVRVRWLYQRMIPTTGPYDCGWHAVEGLPLSITPGTGEIGLPLRLLNPPTVSVLRID